MTAELTKYQILAKYFMDNFPMEMLLDNQPPQNWREERAKFYFEQIGELKAAIDRISRYSTYFAEFYPSSSQNITDAEAIEYHWHSYIHDFYLLEERVKKIVGCLKNDLPRYQIGNPEVAKQLLDYVKNQIFTGLKSAHDLRRKHTHEKTARNFDLTRANVLKLIKESGTNINPKIFDAKIIDDKIIEFTTKSKKEFIDMAAKNAKGMAELENFFAPRFGHLFAFLNDHDISAFKMN